MNPDEHAQKLDRIIELLETIAEHTEDLYSIKSEISNVEHRVSCVEDEAEKIRKYLTSK